MRQLERCVVAEEGAAGVLCADGHVGYSQPVGGAVAYRRHISVSGVGYDIGCGNKAVRTGLRRDDVAGDLPRVMDEIVARISFGVGRAQRRAGRPPGARRDPRRRRGLAAGAADARRRPARHRRRGQPLRRPVHRRGGLRLGRRALRLARLRPQDGDALSRARRRERRRDGRGARRCSRSTASSARSTSRRCSSPARTPTPAATWSSTGCWRSSAPPPRSRSTTTTTSRGARPRR